MARGRPPGIRRKLAAQKEALSEKLDVSQVGEVAEHTEFELIRMVQQQLKNGLSGGHPGMASLRRIVQQYIGILALSAIEEGNAGFFQRCSEALRDVVDPKGVRVLEAVYQLARAPGCPATFSSENVLDHLQGKFPGEPPLDAKDVRDVMEGLGLKFPFERDRIRDEDARKSDELLRVISTPFQELPGFPQQPEGDPGKAGDGPGSGAAGEKKMSAAEVAAEFHRLVEAGRIWDEKGKLIKRGRSA